MKDTLKKLLPGKAIDESVNEMSKTLDEEKGNNRVTDNRKEELNEENIPMQNQSEESLDSKENQMLSAINVLTEAMKILVSNVRELKEEVTVLKSDSIIINKVVFEVEKTNIIEELKHHLV